MAQISNQSSVPFVGRKAEMEQLRAELRQVIGGSKSRFCLIQGDVGTGKTTFVEYFLAQIAGENPEILIGRGKCSMETALNGLLPFSQLFASLAEEAGRQRLVVGDPWEFVKEVAPAWIDLFYSGVGTAAAKTLDQTRKLVGGETFSKENVFVQFTHALARLGQKRTLIAFLDDLHWADASSLDLLFYLSRHLGDKPILFVLTYRPVEAMVTGALADLFRDIRANLVRYGATELELHQGIDVAEYIARRYPLATFPTEFAAQVQKLTEGHPLFVSQLFSMWEETGILKGVPTPSGQFTWSLTQPLQAFPTLLQLNQVLAARLQMITDELRGTLDVASVEGGDFTAQVIVGIHDSNEFQVLDQLCILERRYRLVEEQESRETELVPLDRYRFTHRFFREYIYGDLSKAKQRFLHRQIARRLEALYPDRRSISAQLAMHLSQARDLAQAAKYAELAAELEQSHFAWAEGERWCTIGLDWLQKLPPGDELMRLRFDLLARSGLGHYQTGKYAQGESRYREAMTLLPRLQLPPDQVAELYMKLADCCEGMGRFEEAVGLVEQGQQFLLDHQVPFSEIQIKLDAARGFMYTRFGEYDQAARSLRQTLAASERVPPTPTLQLTQAHAWNWLSNALSNLDAYAESAAACQKALELADQLNEPQPEVSALLTLAENYLYLGKLAESEESTAKALQLIHRTGDQDDESFANMLYGSIFLARGQWQEGIEKFKEALTLSEEIGSTWNMPALYAYLATAYKETGNLEQAYDWAHRAVADKQHFERGFALDALAQVEAAKGDFNSAEQHFQEAVDLHTKAGDRHLTALAQRHFAQAMLKCGNSERANQLIQSALSTFRELGLTNEIIEGERIEQAIRSPS